MALATCLNPAVAAIKALQAGSFIKRHASGNGLFHGAAHALTVVRVQAAHQSHALGQLLTLVAQQPGYALRMGGAPLQQVPVPHAAATAIERQAQGFFTAHEGRSGGAHFAHIQQHAQQVRRHLGGGGYAADVTQHR